MIKLSVIIVNYNVEYFLEQCLHSVKKASEFLLTETIVVDNDSADGSCKMVKEKFPWVELIENKENVGFSKANNQAMRIAKGEYFLLLNPDTIVEEDTFEKTVSFMDGHSDAGGLGVKMIDGKGNFLPESKRGVPTPMVAFYKIFGLSKLFPRSPRFSRYHLGHLDKDETHEVEILSGAFMLMRKSVLDKIGLLDEDYFMYGEDIDLSYRIIKAGYKNYYFSESTIIHYKGESTKKGSINYVFVFYRAMVIFAKKQLSSSHAKIFSFLINCAIYFRAGVAIVKRCFDKLLLPLLDFALSGSAAYASATVVEKYLKVGDFHFPVEMYSYAILIFAIFSVLVLAISNVYKQSLEPKKLLQAQVAVAVLSLIVYSLLPEALRYSRASLLISLFVSFGLQWLIRFVGEHIPYFSFVFSSKRRRNLLLVANSEEAGRIKSVLELTNIKHELVAVIDPTEFDLKEFVHHIGNCVGVYKADEIIFSAQSMPLSDIISSILAIPSNNIDFKIAPPESLSIIGSNSIHTSGDIYLLDMNSINTPSNRLKKRVLDVCVAGILVPFALVLYVVKVGRRNLLPDIYSVIVGEKTLVSYADAKAGLSVDLPAVKPGLVDLKVAFGTRVNLENYVLNYVKNYSAISDLLIIKQNLRVLFN